MTRCIFSIRGGLKEGANQINRPRGIVSIRTTALITKTPNLDSENACRCIKKADTQIG